MRILDVFGQEIHDRLELFDKTLKESCQKIILEEIIELKNQKELYLVKD